MRRTRIFLAEMPRMLCDIITSVVATQRDMVVVGRLPDLPGLMTEVSKTGAEVVVIGLPDSTLPAECDRLFDAYPHIRVLGIAADGRRAFLYEMRPHQSPLGEVSPERLVEVIRGSTRPSAAGQAHES